MKIVRILTLCLAVALIASCRQDVPVYNATSSSFVGTNSSLAQRGEQIRRAGAQLGWAMDQVAPDKIVGTLNLRSHRAVVDIPYTQEKFSIIYTDSMNLNYNGSQIHPNYNGWVQRLEQAIIAQSGV